MNKKRIIYNKINEKEKRYVYFIYKDKYKSREDITEEEIFYCVIDNGIISNKDAWEELACYIEEEGYDEYSKSNFILFSTDKDLFEGE